MSGRTPGPWYVRTLPDGSGAFVEAAAPGRPYKQEILADDYWPEFSKADDVVFIVAACNSHDELVAALRGLLSWDYEQGEHTDPRWIAARAALAKVQS